MKKAIFYSFILCVTLACYACNDSASGPNDSIDSSNTSADSMTRNNDFQHADSTADTTGAHGGGLDSSKKQ